MSKALCVLAVCVVLLTARVYERFLNPSMRIHFFDVGQGDATLVQFPGGTTWLVDAGNRTRRWDIGERVLVPELSRRGILGLDVAILTHPDADHVGGFKSLLERFRVREFWVSEAFIPALQGGLLAETLTTARAQGTKVRTWQSPVRFEIGSASVQMWGGRGNSSNDRSLILKLEFCGCSVLLTGDIGAEIERAMAVSALTVLKVAHHGSRFSSERGFLLRARPRVSVISSGRFNRYGHPHPLVLEALTQLGSEVLRTDFHGFVEIAFFPDGTYTCATAIGSCGRGYCESKPS